MIADMVILCSQKDIPRHDKLDVEDGWGHLLVLQEVEGKLNEEPAHLRQVLHHLVDPHGEFGLFDFASGLLADSLRSPEIGEGVDGIRQRKLEDLVVQRSVGTCEAAEVCFVDLVRNRVGYQLLQRGIAAHP